MRRLTRAVLRRARAAVGPGRRGGSEHGAAAAIVAIVAGMGVMMGMGAVVIDVGRLYAEREQLLSGADAAARALAEQCVRTAADCGQNATAQGFANANANDGTAGVAAICGNGPNLSPGCPAPTNLTGCLGEAPADINYVEAHTETQIQGGGSILPGTFIKALTGGAYAGATVAACARAAWGPPARARGLSLTFSVCEWNDLTGDGLNLWPSGGGTPPASSERVVTFHTTKSLSGCPAGPSGWDAPGSFGWLDEDGTGLCEVTVDDDGSYGGDPGASASQNCRTALDSLHEDRVEIPIPIYDGVRGAGSNTEYHLAGFASFVLTGYRFPGASANSWLPGGTVCPNTHGGSTTYVCGYFTSGRLLPIGQIATSGANFGVVVVDLVG
ncbi:pilus assembly protein TadG-related protein [Pilimelia columellifera]|uniref:Putative Flp pilus-assembly TadG-like N-terminal domain-containing protein n=1 Tax=Pilimelia columellifera subsp. columellifera TaxID=706583 RepID=A0ABP6B2L6_9ACTN